MMLGFDEARARLLADVRRVSSERSALGESAGRVLAENLVAREPLPPFDYSAMDGYAVATRDLKGEGPWSLPVVGQSQAGRDAPSLAAGTACRIFTGAPIPALADAVVMQEHGTEEGRVFRFGSRPKAGQHIRRAGEDLPREAIAIAAGTRLTPGAIALAAMLDRSEFIVARRPCVTILCTGDELRSPGSEKRPASIPESNSASLAALARQAGASVRIAPLVLDESAATRRAIEAALDGTDVLLTVGGVSVGDHDVVRAALEDTGVVLDFWKVAIKPGKPLAVGSTPRARVLGLPGNPASALVTFAMFGMPLLRAMQGDACPLPMRFVVRLARPRKRSVDRLEFVRASLRIEDGVLTADAHDNQASGSATSLAHSEGVALVSPGAEPLEAGALVDFVRWGDT
jgi:molybdopterin molybdotransferase